MCRNIRPLFNFEPPATDTEIRASALQYVRKVSGFTKPSQANEAAFERAVDEVAAVTRRLVDSLVTKAPPKDREVEAAKARKRAAARYGSAATGLALALLLGLPGGSATAQQPTAGELADLRVPVITRALENRPTQFDRLATRFEGPGILAEAGVPVALSTHDSHAAGQLPHEAANAIRYGMSREAALRAVTLEPARVFGLDDELGSLEGGKLANVVIWSGDPFDFSGYAERVFIEGREVDLDSRQRRLFERYRTIP